MRTFFIFLFVAIVSLVVYNPEMDDFRAYYESVSLKRQFDQERSSIVTRMFEPDTVSMGASSSTNATERNSYLLFSTYNVTVHIEDEEFVLGRYLGIAGMFFDLGGDTDIMEAHAAQP